MHVGDENVKSYWLFKTPISQKITFTLRQELVFWTHERPYILFLGQKVKIRKKVLTKNCSWAPNSAARQGRAPREPLGSCLMKDGLLSWNVMTSAIGHASGIFGWHQEIGHTVLGVMYGYSCLNYKCRQDPRPQASPGWTRLLSLALGAMSACDPGCTRRG